MTSLASKRTALNASRRLLPFLLIAALPFAVRAQEAAPAPVHWSAQVKGSQHAFAAGQKFTVALTAAIDSGWHVYAFSQPPGSPVVATDITVPDGQPASLSGDIEPPAAESRMDPTIGKETSFYEDSVTFDLPLKVSKHARAGKQNVEIDVRFQACNDRLCLSPRTEKVEATVAVSSRP